MDLAIPDLARFTLHLGFNPTRQLAREECRLRVKIRKRRRRIHYDSAELNAFPPTCNSHLFIVCTSRSTSRLPSYLLVPLLSSASPHLTSGQRVDRGYPFVFFLLLEGQTAARAPRIRTRQRVQPINAYVYAMCCQHQQPIGPSNGFGFRYF